MMPFHGICEGRNHQRKKESRLEKSQKGLWQGGGKGGKPALIHAKAMKRRSGRLDNITSKSENFGLYYEMGVVYEKGKKVVPSRQLGGAPLRGSLRAANNRHGRN